MTRVTCYLCLQEHRPPEGGGESHALSLKRCLKWIRTSYWDHLSGALRQYES
jgi:hypothetical protein